MRLRWPGFVLVVAVLALWELSGAMGWVNTVSLPRVSTIVSSWVQALANGNLPAQFIPTLRRIALGLALAFAIGAPLGLLIGRRNRAFAGTDRTSTGQLCFR